MTEHHTASSAARRCLAVASLLLIAVSCTGDVAREEAATPPRAIELKVMTFNILYGGSYGFGRVLRVIRKVDPDIVGIQEPYGRILRIADALGWYGSSRLHVLSRFPVLEPTDGGGDWGFVEVMPGRVVAIANTHLPSLTYGPYQVRNGDSAREVQESEERQRMPWTREVLSALGRIPDPVPVLLTGDFNSPSHLDWTEEAAAARDDVPFPMRWPVTAAVEQAGFMDSYREAHPDPVAAPGFTWTPGSGFPPRIREDEVHDRIDYVWASGPVEVIDSQVVAEAAGPYTDIGFDSWPSDHRAVVSTFSVTPAAPPRSVAVGDHRIEQGQEVDVTFFAPGEAGERISLTSVSEGPVGSAPTGADAPTTGTVTFPSAQLEPGRYRVQLLSGGGRVAGVGFWVVDPQDPVRVDVATSRVTLGSAIRVRWENAPGNRYDWLAVTPAGRGPGSYLAWRYFDAAVGGSALIDEDSNGRWPLPAGEYQVHLCVDDSYRCEAVSRSFRVSDR